jgi:hypothetical protein
VVIASVAGAIVRVRLALAVCEGELESLTLNTTATLLAAAVGVPLITPVAEFNVKPLGSVPEVIDQV